MVVVRGAERGYAGEVVDIESLTKIQIQDFLALLCVVGAEQGEVLAGEWECVTQCINLVHISLNFHKDVQ